MINRQDFFTKIRATLFKGSLTQLQVDILEAILNECEKQGVDDLRHIAYILATPYHECYDWTKGTPEGRLIQLKEKGTEKYLKSKPYWPYIGRGPSHLTWAENYRKEGERLGFDLLKSPDIMLDINIGANSHVYCMKNGNYTRKKLSDYIHDEICDFVWARRVITGTKKGQKLPDSAELVAGYAEEILLALS